MANLFEKVLLKLITSQHNEAEEQFGFKGESSCAHAIAVLKMLIKLCGLRRKTCYICALDASKAFDKVERTRLWNKLFDAKICSAVIFAIIAYYDSLKLQVQNGNEKSEYFETSVGVRQGGIMSPKLYNMYSNKLIRVVNDTRTGIEITNRNLGILMYADDLTLTADTKEKLQLLLDAVGDQGVKDDIKFNAKKSVIMIFNGYKSDENIAFTLNNTVIPITKETRYLGYQLSITKNNSAHINSRKSKVVAKVAKLKTLGLLTNKMSPHTKAYLYKTYLRPIALFGMENAELSKEEIAQIKTIEGNALKTVIGINKQVRTSPLFNTLNIEATNVRLLKDKISLFLRLCKNSVSNQLLIHMNREFPDESLIGEISQIVNFDCKEISETDKLCELLSNEITRLTNNAFACRNIEPLGKQLMEIMKEYDKNDFTIKIRQLIGFK